MAKSSSYECHSEWQEILGKEKKELVEIVLLTHDF